MVLLSYFPTSIYLPLKNERTTLLTFQDYSGITFVKALCLSYIYKHWNAHYSSQPSPKSWGSSFFPISTQTTAVNHREMTPEDLEYKSTRMMCTIISSNFVFQSIIAPPNPDFYSSCFSPSWNGLGSIPSTDIYKSTKNYKNVSSFERYWSDLYLIAIFSEMAYYKLDNRYSTTGWKFKSPQVITIYFFLLWSHTR